MSRIVHFEIPAEKPEQIAEFYKKVLGWDIIKWGGPVDYWLVGTGPLPGFSFRQRWHRLMRPLTSL